jgi:hypothetical protein
MGRRPRPATRICLPHRRSRSAGRLHPVQSRQGWPKVGAAGTSPRRRLVRTADEPGRRVFEGAVPGDMVIAQAAPGADDPPHESMDSDQCAQRRSGLPSNP